MIQVSMEIPTVYLSQWTPFTDLDFILAHKVLEDDEYASFFANRPSRREVILDNSMHELGHPLPVSDLLDAAERVNATYVIPPDRLGEWKRNLDWYEETVDAFEGTDIRVAPVMCGTSPEERVYTRHKYKDAHMICLPFREPRKDWYNEHLDACIEKRETLWERIHLLGVNEFSELKLFRQLSDMNLNQVFSVDTAKPIKWGVEGFSLELMDAGNITARNAKLSSKDLLELDAVSNDVHVSIMENLSYLKRVCQW